MATIDNGSNGSMMGSGHVDTNRDKHEVSIIIGSLTFTLQYEQWVTNRNPTNTTTTTNAATTTNAGGAVLTLFHTTSFPKEAPLPRVSHTIHNHTHMMVIMMIGQRYVWLIG